MKRAQNSTGMRELLIAYREHRLSKTPPPPPWSARAGWPDELLDALKSVKGAAIGSADLMCSLLQAEFWLPHVRVRPRRLGRDIRAQRR
jgi:hypothetical protein